MMDKVIFGRYVPVESLLHRMDPRSKLLIIFIFVCVVFIANNSLTYGILLAYTILMILLSKVRIRFILSGLIPVLWLVLFTLLLHLFFTREGALIVDWGWVKIYEEGIRQGIFISMRFLLLVLVTSLLTLTTTPIEITDGIEYLLAPLKKVNFPVHELALMMSISLRFIPTLMQETDKIMKAQMARGIDFSSGPIKERIKAVVPLLVPLFVRSEERRVGKECR